MIQCILQHQILCLFEMIGVTNVYYITEQPESVTYIGLSLHQATIQGLYY